MRLMPLLMLASFPVFSSTVNAQVPAEGYIYRYPLNISLSGRGSGIEAGPGSETTEPALDPVEWSIAQASLPEAIEGQAYSYDFSTLLISDSPLEGIAWSSIDLPNWLTLASGSGAASGTTPSLSASIPEFQIVASHGEHGTRQTPFTITYVNAWKDFARTNGLTYEDDWNYLSWASKGLSALPAYGFPNPRPNNGLLFPSNDLTSLGGLHTLRSITYNFNLYNNSLSHVNELSNLESVGRDFSLSNNAITSLSGLSSLTSVGQDLKLDANQLSDLTGLENLSSVGRHFTATDNSLTNITALSNLTSVGGDFNIGRNSITSLEGFALTSVGGKLYINSNQLTHVNELSIVTSVGGMISLSSNPGLADLTGLANITHVGGGTVWISDSIASLPGFVGIPAEAWLCQPEQASLFPSHYSDQASQEQVCQ